jgi:HD-GYP domain-containing protein (c-di-GMP phosphodiesterase class II)
MRGGPLLDALESHFPGSRDAAEASSSYAFAIAVELGLGRANAELTREAAKLHDIGRIYVPAELLAKPSESRTPEEEARVAAHHEYGAQLALGAGLPARVCEWIRLGSERYDGGGPDGLAGETIPLQSRISRGARACYAALTAQSRGAEPQPSPIEALRGASGRELDPLVVDALGAILSRARSD